MNAELSSKLIDHTLLKAEASKDDIKKLCDEAKKYDFASVCVNPSYVAQSYALLKDTDVKVCTVIGFPLGATTTATKVFEAKEAIENGATELDMVINNGAVKSGDWDYVRNDISKLNTAVSEKGALLKVIIETSLLSDEEKVKICEICKDINVGFVKTSTGFGTAGATAHDVSLMRKTVGENIGVKASGGIRDANAAREMVAAGANRLGTSAGVAIVTGAESSKTGY
ncbi:MAG: deoxyribose-phosphate aldolase [Oscillospiraceae bacterium]|nr:deoxyribose-phosphate aldolase [Oscillospiraceae bacterium]